jgi:hypothetical protein
VKYFTPARYVRLQDADDMVADAVDEEWETVGAEYVQRLDVIRGNLPSALLKLIDTYYLHDAKVSRLARAGDDFLIEIRPIYPPEDLILLRYALVSEPSLNHEAFSGKFATSHVLWMYDEIDFDSISGTFTQDILFSNGWELGLRFRDVELILAQDLLPAPDPRKSLEPASRTA